MQNARAAARMEALENGHQSILAATVEEIKVHERARVVQEQGAAQRTVADEAKAHAWQAGLDYLIDVAASGPSESITEFRRR